MKKRRDQQLPARRHHLAAPLKPRPQAKGAQAGLSGAAQEKPVDAAAGMDPRLAAALERGEVVRQQLAADEGGSVSSAQAARLLGISKAAALRRWRAHRLVGWKQVKAVRFPVWQFAKDKVLEGIEAILQILDSDDHWRVMMYFLGRRLSLGSRLPLDLLRAGKAAKVIRHAHIYALDNTW